MDPVEFIDLGKKIQNDTNYKQEPRYRCSISRIYYGILHFFVFNMKIRIVNNKRFHKEAIEKINIQDSYVGSLIVKIQGLRNKADYNLNQPIDSNEYARFMLTCKIMMSPYEIEI